MKKAATTNDLTARAKILRTPSRSSSHDQAYLPLLFYGSKNLVSDKVVGFEPNTLDRHLSRFLSIKPTLTAPVLVIPGRPGPRSHDRGLVGGRTPGHGDTGTVSRGRASPRI